MLEKKLPDLKRSGSFVFRWTMLHSFHRPAVRILDDDGCPNHLRLPLTTLLPGSTATDITALLGGRGEIGCVRPYLPRRAGNGATEQKMRGGTRLPIHLKETESGWVVRVCGAAQHYHACPDTNSPHRLFSPQQTLHTNFDKRTSMNTKPFLPLALLALALTATGCSVIGDVIKFSVWTGIIIAVVVIGLIWLIVSKFRGK